MSNILKEPVEIRLARAKTGKNEVELDELSRDSFWFVRNFVAANKHTPIETLTNLLNDPDGRVRFEAKKNIEGRKTMLTVSFENKILEKNMQEILFNSEEKFRYQMLSRMKQDCEYYLGYGNRHAKHLWAGEEQDHIKCMKLLWESFASDAKPEWLTLDDIRIYEEKMLMKRISDINKKNCSFYEVLQDDMGIELDNYFNKKGWTLEMWIDGVNPGYQVFFGKNVQVDNNFEYGFPYLYDKEELIEFAKGFYQTKLSNETFEVAILQLGHYEEHPNLIFKSLKSLERQGVQPDISNYEIIHLKEIQNGISDDLKICNSLYSEFNADCLRPADYYGHSLSISDVIVLHKVTDNFTSYYVDSVGFKELPDTFLSEEVKDKISTGVDVRKEFIELKSRASESSFNEEQNARLEQLKNGYTKIFEMADKRAELLEQEYNCNSLNTLIDNAKNKVNVDSKEKTIMKENDLSL